VQILDRPVGFISVPDVLAELYISLNFPRGLFLDTKAFLRLLIGVLSLMIEQGVGLR
jgi:hypothetical protein